MEEDSEDENDARSPNGVDADEIIFVDPDDPFEGQFGYWAIQLLRGSSSGRKLKRQTLKLGLLNFIFGIMLLIVMTQGCKCTDFRFIHVGLMK